jgi:hypothetical protein
MRYREIVEIDYISILATILIYSTILLEQSTSFCLIRDTYTIFNSHITLNSTNISQ